jgi:hypothetical protein
LLRTLRAPLPALFALDSLALPELPFELPEPFAFEPFPRALLEFDPDPDPEYAEACARVVEAAPHHKTANTTHPIFSCNEILTCRWKPPWSSSQEACHFGRDRREKCVRNEKGYGNAD